MIRKTVETITLSGSTEKRTSVLIEHLELKQLLQIRLSINIHIHIYVYIHIYGYKCIPVEGGGGLNYSIEPLLVIRVATNEVTYGRQPA